ncbi:MAG: hypothetical protein Q9191_007682 [Dirinaria sp. TL-2023a]
MVKSYLKYEHSKTFGLIASASSNIVWSPHDSEQNAATRSSHAGRAIVGADEEVLCWDVKKGELLSRWKDNQCSAAVSAIARSTADPDVYAVGYDDGSIRLWDSRLATVLITFNGHRSAVTALAFDKQGVRLASGAKDTDLIIWDLIGEVGLFKLRGHKDQVTALHFLQAGQGRDDALNGGADYHTDFLLTTSKDALIKIWNLQSQHCIETHVAQSNGECWSMGVYPDGSGCITAGNEGELKVWSIDTKGLSEAAERVAEGSEKSFLHQRGIIYRHGKDRTTGVSFHPNGSYILAHGSEKAVELWRIRSESEVQRTMTRKRKRRREKLLASDPKDSAQEAATVDGVDGVEDISTADISDVIVPYVIVRTGGKIRSVDWVGDRPRKALQLLTATNNNQLEVYSIPVKSKDKKSKSDEPPDYQRTLSVDLPGHRTDIRSLALSSDDRMLASSSNGSLKIWNVRTQSCIRTLDCGYSLCSSFLPGDKIVVVGNRNGELELFDIASSTLIDTIKAHDGPIWTLHVHPDGRSMATGSADKSAKFFNFEVIQEEIPGTSQTTPRFKLVHTRTLKVADDILSLRFSPDSRLVAISLLDNTVKVFFTDSLKLFLNLYGHKLPVLSLDISFDSKFIVTCSADKNVRLWGLDFGDCHKAFFAHQDSILQVCFVPHNQDGNGHHFFSASKDRLIKYWDGDKFEQIQKLPGHHGEIWALAVSRTGEFLVSASHDKSIRIWQQTDEQIFLEEEREKELEDLYEHTLTTSLDIEDDDPSGGAEKSEVAPKAGKQTTQTLMAGERIAEALELGTADLELMRDYTSAVAAQKANNSAPPAPPQRHPLFLAHGSISAEQYLLNLITRIPAAALTDALLVLPFAQIPALLTFLALWAERGWNMPLTCRVLVFVLKTHHRQIVASRELRIVLEGVRGGLRRSLKEQKDLMGFNLAALRVVGRRIEEREVARGVVGEDEEGEAGEAMRKKRGFVDIA